MKKLTFLMILLTAVAGMSYAQTGHQGGNTGIGLIFGEPTGLSLKYWTTSTIALDGAAAWSFVNGGSFEVHADLLFHSFQLFHVDRGRVALFYGFGGRFKTATDTEKARVSFRVPIGIAYEFEGVPIELFFEVAPMLDIVPSTEAAIGGGMGFRYYF
jgi:hypothetical protein